METGIQEVIDDAIKELREDPEFEGVCDFLTEKLEVLTRDDSDPESRVVCVAKADAEHHARVLRLLELCSFTTISDDAKQTELALFEDASFAQTMLARLRLHRKEFRREHSDVDINYLRKQAFLERQRAKAAEQSQDARSPPTEGDDYHTQRQQYRERMRQQYRDSVGFNGKNIVTLDKLDQKLEADYENGLKLKKNQSQLPGGADKLVTLDKLQGMVARDKCEQFGKEALRLTNEYRKQHGLKPLEWNEQLSLVGFPHSKLQGDRRSIGHDGFKQREQQVRFRHALFAENVAMCSDTANVPKLIVDGWYNSPGHKKNMLSQSNVCGIAVYYNSSNEWYFTQLFAKKL